MITLTMTSEDYTSILFMIGATAGALSKDGNRRGMYAAVALANRLNKGNPDYTPYHIPEEYHQGHREDLHAG